MERSALNALFIPADDAKAWRGFWGAFNSHGSKQGAARVYGQGFLRKLNEERWSRFYQKQIPERLPLNELKLASMYVDCYDELALHHP